MAAETKQALVVTVSGDRPIQEVAKDLKAAGFEINQILEFIGSITGSAPTKSLKQLRAVPGVAGISEDHPIDIGPPDASIS